MWDRVPWPGMKLRPLHWELRVLTTGSPEKSQVKSSVFYKSSLACGALKGLRDLWTIFWELLPYSEGKIEPDSKWLGFKPLAKNFTYLLATWAWERNSLGLNIFYVWNRNNKTKGHVQYAFKVIYIKLVPGIPVGTSGKELTCQHRRHKRCRFDPWVGKIPWRRAWQPTPVFLAAESHGQRNLVDYSP